MLLTRMTHRSAALLTSSLVLTGLALVATPTAPAVAAPPPNLGQVEAPNNGVLLIDSNGTLRGAGGNDYGQLGTGSIEQPASLTPAVGLPAGTKVAQVASDSGHAVLRTEDGYLYGAGQATQLSMPGLTGLTNPTFTAMGVLPGGVKATDVATGYWHSVAVGANGTVYGAGDNVRGQLTGTDSTSYANWRALTGLPAGVSATGVDATYETTVVRGSDGLLYGTGGNASSELTGTQASLSQLTLVSGLPAGTTVSDFALSFTHLLVAGSDGVVYGAGSGDKGQLTGAVGKRTTLTPLAGLPAGVQAKKVVAGPEHSLVIGSNGVVYGTGTNTDGRLTGTSTTLTTLTPLTGLPAGVKAVQASSGSNHTVVLGSDGVFYGTGISYRMGFPAGTPEVLTTLTPLDSQTTIKQVAPRVTGTAVVGKTLQVGNGSWWPVPQTHQYQWLRDGQPIAGATGKSYKLTTADWRKRITARVTAQRTGYLPSTATSNGLVPLKPALTYKAKKKPTVAGTTKVGKKLSVAGLTLSGWTAKADRHQYQWLRDGKVIKGATKASYLLKAVDRKHRIQLRITAIKKDYVSGTYTTKATKKVT